MAREEPSPGELRYRAVSVLLQAGEPLALPELVQRCGVTERALLPALRELQGEGLVVQGELVPANSGRTTAGQPAGRSAPTGASWARG